MTRDDNPSSGLIGRRPVSNTWYKWETLDDMVDMLFGPRFLPHDPVLEAMYNPNDPATWALVDDVPPVIGGPHRRRRNGKRRSVGRSPIPQDAADDSARQKRKAPAGGGDEDAAPDVKRPRRAGGEDQRGSSLVVVDEADQLGGGVGAAQVTQEAKNLIEEGGSLGAFCE